jgi:GTP pyrophosphokinase
MHAWAEEGIAAHWRYKEKLTDKTKEGEQIQKLRELLELHQDLQNPHEFMSNLKVALFPDKVYVFTPKGDVKAFPKGATPIDFAYSIHTDVGHQCVGAKVNQSIVSLKYELQNGDIVEIITQAGHYPSKDWLKYSVTSKARAKIKNWVSAQEKEKSINLGRDLLEREFQRQHLKFSQIIKSNDIKKVYDEYGISSPEELMGIVGYGKVSAKRVVKYFLPEAEAKTENATTEKKGRKEIVPTTTGISLTGIEDVLERFAKCCDPIPGDDIVGFVSRGRGINIHVADCPNVRGMGTERFVNVSWNIKEKHTYPVNMRVRCIDKKGILAEISAVISSLDVNISHAEINTEPHIEAVCDFVIDVHDLKQLNQIVAAIKKLDAVTSIERLKKA